MHRTLPRTLPALGMALALVAGPQALLPAAAAGDTNGPLLVRGAGSAADLRRLDGDLVTALPSDTDAVNEQGEFSPDGSRVAHIVAECADEGCTSRHSFIVVRDAGGGMTRHGPFALHISSVTWSPNGEKVAFLGYATRDKAAIYRMSLDGSKPVPIVSDSSTVDVEDIGEISWNPAGGSIIFVGGQALTTEGYFPSRDRTQLYTVSPSGGPISAFNVHYDEFCTYDPAGTCFHEFFAPEWSPSGDSVVVEYVTRRSDGAAEDDERYVGTMQAGDLEPNRILHLNDVHSPGRFWRGPSWSPDGWNILFHDTDNTGPRAATYSLGAGRTQLHGALTGVDDWQPCPSGVCADWSSAVVRAPSALTLKTDTTKRKVEVTGRVTPAKAGQQVVLTLKHKVRGSWEKVGRKTPTLSSTSRYVAAFARSTRSDCLVVGTYRGDADHSPSTKKVTFSC